MTVIRGPVPESFAQGAPEKVAFAHIDMNNARSEIAALDALESRLSPGAVIVLDDFGQLTTRNSTLRIANGSPSAGFRSLRALPGKAW